MGSGHGGFETGRSRCRGWKPESGSVGEGTPASSGTDDEQVDERVVECEVSVPGDKDPRKS